MSHSASPGDRRQVGQVAAPPLSTGVGPAEVKVARLRIREFGLALARAAVDAGSLLPGRESDRFPIVPAQDAGSVVDVVIHGQVVRRVGQHHVVLPFPQTVDQVVLDDDVLLLEPRHVEVVDPADGDRRIAPHLSDAGVVGDHDPARRLASLVAGRHPDAALPGRPGRRQDVVGDRDVADRLSRHVAFASRGFRGLDVNAHIAKTPGAVGVAHDVAVEDQPVCRPGVFVFAVSRGRTLDPERDRGVDELVVADRPVLRTLARGHHGAAVPPRGVGLPMGDVGVPDRIQDLDPGDIAPDLESRPAGDPAALGEVAVVHGAGDVLPSQGPFVGREVGARSAGKPAAVVLDQQVREVRPVQPRVEQVDGEALAAVRRSVHVDRVQLQIVEVDVIQAVAARTETDQTRVDSRRETAVVLDVDMGDLEVVVAGIQLEDRAQTLLVAVARAVEHRGVVRVMGRIHAVVVFVPADQHGRIGRQQPVPGLAARPRQGVAALQAAGAGSDQLLLGEAAETDDVFGAVARAVGDVPGELDRLVGAPRTAVPLEVVAPFRVDVDQVLVDAVAVGVGGLAVADVAVRRFADDAVAVHVEAAGT